MKGLHKLTFLLLAVGGLNWGLIGLFDFNLVTALLGSWPMAEQVVYGAVGLSTVNELLIHMKLCRECEPKAQ